MFDRIIAHVDMDAFFASVEERDKPYLAGMPIVIGADPQGGLGRGVVSTASYAARTYGVRSALPISKAWQLCEAGRAAGGDSCVFIAPNMARYGRVSDEVFGSVRARVPVVEQTSVDEAYLDLTFTGSFEKAEALAREIQREIKEVHGLTCSIGIGENRMIAKVASEQRKPHGFTVVTPQETDAFLVPMLVRAIPGIGPKAAEKFARRGIRTIAQARELSWEQLEALFGKSGFDIYERLRGVDATPVGEEHERKSVGRHHTFDTDTHDMKEVFAVLRQQAERIVRDMHEEGFATFRTVVLTVRFADFTTRTRSLTLSDTRNDVDALENTAIKLALPFFDSRENPHKQAIRLVGLRVEKLK